MKKIIFAFQFLTIIPIKDTGEVSEKEMGSATAFFPLIGLLEGVMLVIVAMLLIKVFPTEVTSALLILVMSIFNGGLHLDGLADTFDSIASRGDSEKKLAIMKDSTIGPAGVIAVVMALLLKYVLLNALFFNSRLTDYYSALFLMPVLSRWTMVSAIFHGKTARQDGLGKIFIDHTGKKELLIATLSILIISLLDFSLISHFSLLWFHFMFAIPALYIFSLLAVWFFNKHFKCMTGDTLGAVNEIAVLLFLLIRVIWSQRFI